MTVRRTGEWYKSAGIDRACYPSLFLSCNEVTLATLQEHVIRHAFELLELDGVFCTEGPPIVFFKFIESFFLDEVLATHKMFWNNGGAPVLVLISNERAEISFGMLRPVRCENIGIVAPAFITKIKQLTAAMSQVLVAIESGAFFREHARSFDASQRALSAIGIWRIWA